MIFVGDGALLTSAITFTKRKGYKIDYVISQSSNAKKICDDNNIPFKITDVNNEIHLFLNECVDKTVFSIDNGQLFNEKILSLEGFRFFNIHNGIIPNYRGIGEICVLYAILNEEKEYGISLHKISKKIDAGPCIEVLKFPIPKDADFQYVMSNSIKYCLKVFENNLDKILQHKEHEIPLNDSEKSRLFRYSDIKNLGKYKKWKNFKRATRLGLYKLYFPYIQKEIDSI